MFRSLRRNSMILTLAAAAAFGSALTSLPFLEGNAAVASTLVQDSWEESFRLYKANNYPAAMAMWERLGAAGDSRGFYALGTVYRNGESVPKDHAKANAYFERAVAIDNNSGAHCDLGDAYIAGLGVAKDVQKAHDHYRMGALRGHEVAMVRVGILYVNGEGVIKRDLVEASAWYTLADELGAEHARGNLQNLEQYLTAEQKRRIPERVEQLRAEMNQLKGSRNGSPNGAPATPGAVMIRVKQNDNGEVVITAVKPGSIAEECQLAAGDVIVEIDGKPVKNMSPQDFTKAIEGPTGSTIQMRLSRNGDNIQVAMPREEIPQAPAGNGGGQATGTVGIELTMKDDGTYVIQKMSPTSRGANMGIEPGDVIVSIDGRKVTGLPPAQIGALMAGPEGSIIQFELSRNGRVIQVAFPRDPAGRPAQTQPSRGLGGRLGGSR